MRVPFGRPFALFVFPLALLAVQQTQAQRPDQPPVPRAIALGTDRIVQTKLEALLATPATLLTTDFYRMDTRFGPNVVVEAVVVTAVDLRKRLRGIRISLREDAKPVSRSSWSYLDLDEGTGLSRALASMTEIAGKWSGREEQRSMDIAFTTVGGFAVGVHQIGHLQRAFLSSGFTDPVRTSIEVIDFMSLKQTVNQALAVLADK